MLPIARMLLCLFSLFQGAATSSGQAIQFHAADVNLDPKVSEVYFEPFQTLNWARIARRDFKSFDLDHPTPAQFEKIKKDSQDHPLSEATAGEIVQFYTPLEPSINRCCYYLIADRQINPLQPLKSRVTIVITLNHNLTGIQKKDFSGELVAKMENRPAGDAAFVAFANSPLSFAPISDATFTALKQDRQDTYTYARGGKTLTLSVPDQGLFEVLQSTAFRLGGQEYILVHWKPDTENHYGGCDRQFSLFVVGEQLQWIANNQSGCDV